MRDVITVLEPQPAMSSSIRAVAMGQAEVG